ncbi:MAG TPA: transcriptional repressor LexA [Planctomycetota bacterium]|nr:transcriptional repressor LexA [Planctomycetota bacterium]
MNLTPKQLEIVQFIVDYRERKGLAPTLEEIARELGVSKITIYEHVAQLEKKGAITKQKYQSRSLTVAPALIAELRTRREASQTQTFSLPLLGKIAAGQPIEAVEVPEEIDLSDMVRRDRASYILRVKGNSMVDEGIRNGDYVIVENRNWASNGETVVAVINDNEATLKKFYREGERIRLQPANAEMAPIYVDKCDIRGVVVGVLRKY